MEDNSPVVCIGIWGEPGRDLPFKKSEIIIPEKGKNYTIRDVITTEYGIGIRLLEIKNPEFYFDNIKRKEEPIFGIEKFQLIKKQKKGKTKQKKSAIKQNCRHRQK